MPDFVETIIIRNVIENLLPVAGLVVLLWIVTK